MADSRKDSQYSGPTASGMRKQFRGKTMKDLKKDLNAAKIKKNLSEKELQELTDEISEREEVLRTLLPYDITDLEQATILVWGEHHFNIKRKGLMKSETTVDKMIVWKNDPIKMGLMKLTSEQNREAATVSKGILALMGDRDSNKPDEEHIQKITQCVHLEHAVMRDEVFCQLCKQVTKNPNPESLVKGWELIILCMANFPPSQKFEPFLTNFINMHTKEDHEDYEIIGQHAEYARERIATIIKLGARDEVMVFDETQQIMKQQPHGLKVHFVDGSFKMLEIDAWTTSEVAVETFCTQVLKLDPSQSGAFALFEADHNDADEITERVLEATERPHDTIAGWARIQYELEEEKGRKAANRCIEQGGLEWRIVCKVADFSHGVEAGSEAEMTAALAEFSDGNVHDRLVAFFKKFEPEKAEDEAAIAELMGEYGTREAHLFGDLARDHNLGGAGLSWMFFSQCANEVTGGRWTHCFAYGAAKVETLPHQLAELCALAALHIQTRYGDEHEVVADAEGLGAFVPPFLLEDFEGREGELMGKIDAAHAKLKGCSPFVAEQRYIKMVQAWPSYGSTFFDVEASNMPTVTECRLAVNPKGVLLVSPDFRNCLFSFLFENDAINTWGNSSTMFALVITAHGGEKLNFRTDEGTEINELLTKYNAARITAAYEAENAETKEEEEVNDLI